VVTPVIVDADGDGVADAQDAFPNDKLEWMDADKDGVGDNADKTPLGELIPAWNTFQGNALHTGAVAAKLDVNNFNTRWTRALAIDNAAQGAAADGYIFINLKGVLYALSSATGNVLWTTNVSAANPPAYADGVVYVETGGHEAAALWAFNAADGKLLFKSKIEDQWSSYYAPTIVDGVVYMAGGYYGGIYAIDAKTGARKWWLGLNQYDQFTPAITADYVFAYTGENRPQLTVIDRKTGALAFNIADPHFEWNGWSMSLAPAVLGDSVVAIHNNRLVHFNLTTKAMDWDIRSSFSGQPSLKGDRIYAINNGSVEVRNLATGALVDTITGTAQFRGDLLLTDNLLFVRDSTNTYAYDITSKQLVWTLKDKSGAFFMADGALYVMATTGLSAINIEGDIDKDNLPDWWEKSFGKNIDPVNDLDKDGLTAAKEFTAATDPFNSDTDGDGLLDGAEVNTHLSSPLSKDSDSDGLSDSAEVNTYRTNPNLADTDGDNLTDSLETTAGLDPLDAKDADKDSDSDGFSNRLEVLANSNPKSAASVPKVGDWAMLHGNSEHNSYQPLMLDAKNFAVRWTTQVKGNATSVATGKGRVYLNDGNNTLSLNAGTGELLWSYPFAGGSTSYVNGKVYGHIGGHQATAFIGLDAANGTLQFSTTHGDQWSAYSAPTVYNGHAYVNGGYFGGMLAFNAASGVKEWEIASPAVDWSNFWEPAVSELGLFVVAQNKLRSLSLKDGSTLFDIDSPVVANGTTPVIGTKGNVLTLGTSVVSYDIANRKVAWQSEISRDGYQSYSYVAVGNSQVYAITVGDLFVFDEANGRTLWSKTITNSFVTSNIVLTASHLFVADSAKTYAIDLASHQVVWTYPKGGQYLSIGNEGALFIANGNEVIAVEIEGDKDADGMPDWWERNYGGNLAASADLDADGLTNLDEFTQRTNPLVIDTDGDTLSDFEEVRTHKTNPLLKDSDKDGIADNIELKQHLTNPLKGDTDDDGLDDATEIQFGLNPNDAKDAAQDSDGDGFSNADEIAAGTDRNNALVFPVAHDWAMLQGNASHDGFQPVALKPANFALRWSKDFGYSINPVATGGGSVFVTSKAYFSSVILSALDPTNASVKWSNDFGSLHSMSGPSYAGNMVYTHSGGHSDTAFWAFNATTGLQKFRSTHGSQWPTYSAPTLYGDKAYMNGGSYGGMVAFDTSNGGKLWEASATWADSLEPAVNESSVFIPLNNQLIIRNRLTGIDQYSIETQLSGTSLVLGKRNNIIATGTTVKSIDIATRTTNWTTVQTNIWGVPAVGNQSVYFISSGTLYVVNEQSGNLLWSWTPPGATLTNNIIATLGHVFVATDSKTYAIDIKTGKQVWSYDRGGNLSLGNDGNLYIAAQTELIAIRVK
jgi:outer membrane protein assembly factor BamB